MACLKLANKYNDQIANVKFGSGLASKMLCVHEGSRDHVANTRNDCKSSHGNTGDVGHLGLTSLKKQMQLEI